MLSNRKGFTLIELLIVVVIIGILAAIAIPKFASTKDKAKLAQVKNDLRNIITAQEAYFDEKGTYATAEADLANYFTKSDAAETLTLTGAASGWTASISHGGIAGTLKSCGVKAGASADATWPDGVIKCPSF